MSRDIRPSRAGAGAFPTRPQQKQQPRYEEYDDEYPVNKRYYSNELPDESQSQSQRGGRANGGRYGDSNASSSLMDRMKVKSSDRPGRTNVDEEYDAPRTGKATWAKKPGQARTTAPRAEERQEAVVAQDPGSAGNTLWGRVVGALTINVSKAWESNGPDGPETPPGGETRLTKAMKAYYLQRARAHTDLPHWLFDEQERMPTRPPARERAAVNGDGSRGRYDEDYGDEAPPPKQQPTRGALRDVYEKAKPAPNRPSPSTTVYGSDTGAMESKATSRLRAMRDARRQEAGVAGGSAYVPSKYDTDYETGRRSTDRTGLPSRPGGSRYN
ncbi:hypothetical protein FRC14_001985 [Serendipita sp. 396]|nr:hypothetical protein FRC14_001985 [Serendipita sp. 396]KAG8785325.1 hypothetical protein FRC15_001598 [Serendipita sp. 397]KAG8801933.1 hypothetical protein FRC16_010763 [Serendipita sp. 398]KAG8825195.1 hypothetical protein FRC19_011928 [Serendipita sp. 401]KAG9057800.1 hypothetical protein FS842_003875 [Serendipita sp. 407]